MGKAPSEGKLDSVIGPDTSVKGDVTVSGSLRLDGSVEGRMDVSDTLLTGPRALLKGDVHCRDAVIAGRIEGNIVAADAVELQTGAQVFGDITCRSLVVQRDCFFEGRCSMSDARREVGNG
uniref:Polymer-forming cytoskeletal family protein n=1 Tax=candidate division WOR-3 bacterium TaxID=2052148 RepID=A0A7C4GC48_UNCW3